MESFLTDLGKTFVEKLINGAIAELRHVFCFTCIANEFEEEKVMLEAEIKTLEKRVKVAAGRDHDIQANVHLWKKKADKLIQEDNKTKQTCFFGLCPDCIWRYKRGKAFANYIQEIKRLIEKAEKFENIELPRRLPDVERYSSNDYISFPSRDSKYKELLDALKDDNNYMIVLQGMGGTGKTTLAKEVGKELKKSKQFAHVIDTTVSVTFDTKKIQDDIAGPLGLKWEDCNDSDRPKKLWSRLTNGEKILLIMDDLWDGGPPLDFDLIGIPKQDNHKGCKVLITTRSKQISNIMGCDRMIELDLLPEEEAWTMFKMYAGIINNSSKSLIATGREICKECKQLPVAIAVIARSLKGQQDRKHKWDATLKSLKKTVSMDDVDDEKVGIYKCLKSSYDCIKDEKSKGLFLLSSIFPEDKEIPIEILTRLGIGAGLFGKNYGSYNDARNEVVVAIDKLIDSCLLMGVDKEHVKMHDLVREAAQMIAYKEIRCVSLSSKHEKSSVEKEKSMKYLFCEGKYMDLFSWKYDGSKLETLILDVERDEDCKCMEAQNSFFKNIDQLKVLYFSGHDKQSLSWPHSITLSLPHSIHSLTNIRSILVDGVDLGDISVLGYLKSLETLDLVNCTINELSQEIAELGKFKVLNLKYCKIRRNDPFEVIKRCSTLEELYFIRSFNRFCRDITCPKLQRYHIRNMERATVHESLSKSVAFDAGFNTYFLSKETFKFWMQTTEILLLDRIKEGWRNLMPEIVSIDLGMKDLVVLGLFDISQLQCLIDTSGSQVSNLLSKLEELSIRHCKMLRTLFNCKINLCNLKTMRVENCPLLVNLFPLISSRNLVLLESLEIINCYGLTNIIIDEGEYEESREEIDGSGKYNKSCVSLFPKLKFLKIQGCDQLESILPILSSQDLPILEVITIEHCHKLEYVFRQYHQIELSSLERIELFYLPNFMGISLNYSHSMSSHVNESSSTSRDGFKAQIQVDPIKCNIFSWSCLCCHGRHKLGNMSTTKVPSIHEDSRDKNSTKSTSSSDNRLQIWEHAQCFRVRSLNLCNTKEITLSYIGKIKSVFILSITPMVDNGDDDNGENNWGNVFPKLKEIKVSRCGTLEYIFRNYTDDYQNHTKIHLPTLQLLDLKFLPSLVSVCPKQYCITFPSLKCLKLYDCPKFVSIGEFIINHSDSKSVNNTITKCW